MDILDRVTQLAERSQAAPVPDIDVCARVQATLRQVAAERLELIDRPTLAFAGLSMAVAGILFVTFLPSVRLLWDPWLAYMNAPWSY